MVILCSHIVNYFFDCRLIVPLEAPTESVCQHLLSEALSERIAVRLENRPQLLRPTEAPPVRQCARGVNWKLAVRRAPGPNRIEVFEPEAERVHLCMA